MQQKKIDHIKLALDEHLVSVLEYRRLHQIITVFVVNRVDFTQWNDIRKSFEKEYFMILHESDITEGNDVFALEFLHMKHHAVVKEGKDIFKNCTIAPQSIRHQLEYELRNKLIYLREEFLRTTKPIHFLPQILPTLIILIDGLIFYKNKKYLIAPLNEKMREVAKCYEIEIDIFERLLAYDQHQSWKKLKKNEVPAIIEAINKALYQLLNKIN